MNKILLTLILILLIPISASATVEFVAIQEFKTDGGTSIAMTAPVGTSVGDLLIAYISKDDDVAIYETGSYGDWNMEYNNITNGQTCLYIAWRIADSGDAAETKTEYTWNGDSEDWLGEILTYSGVSTGAPIHNSGIEIGTSATPTAPSVAFGPHWVSPTGHDDPDTEWTNEIQAYDENLLNGSYDDIASNSWGSYLELTIDAVSCSKVRFYASYVATQINQISLDVYYSSAWHNIYEGAYAHNEWVEKTIGSTQTVTAMRAKFYNDDDASSRDATFREADFWKPNSLTEGSLVLQVMGIDQDDDDYITPTPLEERFNAIQYADIGGAGGDRECTGGWVSPTDFVDPDTTWSDEALAYDGGFSQTTSAATTSITGTSWSDYLELTIASISCSKVRFYAVYNVEYVTQISIDVYYSSAWHNIYEGIFAHIVWVEKEIGSTQLVTAMRVKLYNTGGLSATGRLIETAFYSTGETGTAIFTATSRPWAAATVIIEAEEAPPEGITWNTKTITKWNTKTVTTINTK